jgi:DNA-binding transcriptional LysR family regulator
MDLELRHLRALVAIVDEGSFTDAAITLGVSQATVSRSIASLETLLGARVLARTTREVSPTALGSQIVGRARRILAEVAAVERVAEQTGTELRVGYAWAELGRHTTTVQRRWAAEHPDCSLIFVQSNTVTAGLSDGAADVAVLRRPLDDRRFVTSLVGVEPRYAGVASDDPLARRRTVSLADFTGRTLCVDKVTGTTSEDLWPAGEGPARLQPVHSVDEWLTFVAGGQAVGMTSEATAKQHPRPGIAFRRVRDADPVPVSVGWWRGDPPVHAEAFVALVREVYAEAH